MKVGGVRKLYQIKANNLGTLSVSYCKAATPGGTPTNCGATPPSGAWTPFVLHSFNGADPSGLAVGDNGVVYGSTLQGGSCCGTLFAWTP